MVGEEVGSLVEELILAKNILTVRALDEVCVLDHEKRAGGHRLEGEGADIEPVQISQEDIELLWEVQVDEHDDRDLLNILNGLNQEVPKARQQGAGYGEKQGQPDEDSDDGLVVVVELLVDSAHSIAILVGLVSAVAHAGHWLEG